MKTNDHANERQSDGRLTALASFLRVTRAAERDGLTTPEGVQRYDRIMGAWRKWLWR